MNAHWLFSVHRIVGPRAQLFYEVTAPFPTGSSAPQLGTSGVKVIENGG